MNTFDKILGKKILKIQRLDSMIEYEFSSPYAIIMSLDGLSEKLIISAINDGSSSDIRLTTDQEIKNDYGLEFSEHILNDLKPNDELNLFLGDNIKSIKTAEFILPKISGTDFIIKQGKYAGVELITDEHKLLFRNNYGGWCDIDDDVIELPNPDRWKWRGENCL